MSSRSAAAQACHSARGKGSVARLAVAIAGGALAVQLGSVPLLYAVIGASFVVYAAVPAIAFLRGAWDVDVEKSSAR